MFGNPASWQGNPKTKDENMEQSKLESGIITVCIPKVEPCYPSSDDSNEEFEGFDDVGRSPIPFTAPYKVKDPIVLLERCDKIWETLQLIKDVQSEHTDANVNDNTEDAPMQNVSEIPKAELPHATEPGPSYIKYQPVLGNNNSALPNFRFSVKTTKRVYHCTTCGKQYTENRSLRHHSERVHGIYIPLQRIPKKSEVIVKEKVPEAKKIEMVETEKNSIQQSHIEGNVKEQVKELQSTIPVSKEIEKVHSYTRSQKKPRTSLSFNDNDVPLSETSNREQSIMTPENEVYQRPRRSSTNLVLCVLCKQLVKDIRKHLTEYHKIGCADIMLKELGKTLSSELPTPEKNQTLEKAVTIDKPSIKRSLVVNRDGASSLELQNSTSQGLQRSVKRKKQKSFLSRRKKYKLNNNDILCKEDMTEFTRADNNADESSSKEQQCDICLGVYSNRRSLRRHQAFHHERGETKENFHLFECKYLKSPLCFKQRLSGPESINNSSSSSKHKETDEHAETNATDNIEDTESKGTTGEQSEETTCNCGRSFRNPHTLFIHKTNCKLQGDQDVNASSSSDRDSGIGISITIKKKNNCYEVVSRDSDDENKSKDSSYMKDSETSSDISDYISKYYGDAKTKDQQVDFLEISKYSKYHSILKLECVNEDIHVDIEEDSQNNFCNTIENTKLSANDQHDNSQEKGRTLITKMKQNTSQHQEVPNLTVLCQKVLDKKEPKVTAKTEDGSKENKQCTCGQRFESIKTLSVHMAECYRISPMCGYCQEQFSDSDAYDKHECIVEEGKDISNAMEELPCHFCSIVLPSKKEFHRHIRLKHFDPALPYHCLRCPERFSTKKKYQVHLGNEHAISSCFICHKKFHYYVLWCHVSYHRGLGFPCHLCKRAYSSKQVLLKHENNVHTKMICKSCKRVVKRKTSHNCHKPKIDEET